MLCVEANAQQAVLSGKIIEAEQGEGLSGVTLLVKSSGQTFTTDVKPQANKNKFQRDAPKISDDVRRMLMSGTKDIWLSQFPNPSRANLWKPYVVSEDNGKAVIRFSPASGVKRYILEMNGVGIKGQLLFDRRVIEIPAQ